MRASADSALWWIIVYGLLGSLGALGAASLVLFLSEPLRRRLMPYLLSYATGALLATALAGILPEALERAAVGGIPARSLLLGMLGGLLVFFAVEGLVVWRHGHEHGDEANVLGVRFRGAPPPVLIVVGDALHNFVDGVAITTAFLASPAVGLVTTLAIVGHEIPQEVGDFVLLLHGGLSKAEAIIWNSVSGFGTLFGALVAYIALEQVAWAVPYALSVAGANFLYIGLAGLVPGIHGRAGAASGVGQFVVMLAGSATTLCLPY